MAGSVTSPQHLTRYVRPALPLPAACYYLPLPACLLLPAPVCYYPPLPACLPLPAPVCLPASTCPCLLACHCLPLPGPACLPAAACPSLTAAVLLLPAAACYCLPLPATACPSHPAAVLLLPACFYHLPLSTSTFDPNFTKCLHISGQFWRDQRPRGHVQPPGPGPI